MRGRIAHADGEAPGYSEAGLESYLGKGEKNLCAPQEADYAKPGAS